MKGKVNNKTRDRLYAQAKHDFYEYGYKGCSLKSIAQHAELPTSLFTYYFESKDQLVNCIFDEFYTEIMTLLDSYEEIKNSNVMLKQMLESYIFYDIIFSDPKSKEFYKQITYARDSVYYQHKNIFDDILLDYTKEFGLRISQKQAEIFSVMKYSAQTAFLRYYFETGCKYHIYDIVQNIQSISPKLLGISASTIDSNMIQCSQLIKKVDYSGLKFLV